MLADGGYSTWVEDELSSAEALTRIRLIASSAAIRHLGGLLLSRPEPFSSEAQTEQVWAFCSLLEACLSQTSLRNETRVALAVSPKLVSLLWNDFLKVCPFSFPSKDSHQCLYFCIM